MSLTGPTLQGYTSWLRNYVGISTAVLPDSSPAIPYSYGIALETVNPQLGQIGPCLPGGFAPPPTIPDGTPSIYALAVYNLGADNIINFAPDVPNAPPYNAPDNKDQLPYFQYFRWKWQLLDFVAGVLQSTGDEGTNASFVVPDQFKELTLSNLQNLKTPYGRRYLGLAQSVGTLWGLT